LLIIIAITDPSKKKGRKKRTKKNPTSFTSSQPPAPSPKRRRTAETTLLPSPLTRLLAPKGEEGLRGGIRYVYHAATTLVNAPEGEESPQVMGL
jgi:hypothetical protein